VGKNIWEQDKREYTERNCRKWIIVGRNELRREYLFRNRIKGYVQEEEEKMIT